MKALSIKQPWASLIALGIKDIENRTWKTHFRGRIFIHATSKSVPFNGLENGMKFTLDQLKQIYNRFPISEHDRYPDYMSKYPNSSVIGEVDIVDCVINHHSVWAEPTIEQHDKPIYNWVLANPTIYIHPYRNVKGKLSFWEFDKKKQFKK